MSLNKVYCSHYNCISALGNDVKSHWQAITEKRSGLALQQLPKVAQAFYASKPKEEFLIKGHTAFESLAIACCLPVLKEAHLDLSKTAFILSTTKGNIDLLNQLGDDEISLSHTAHTIAQALGIINKPFVVSQACVSGVVALQYAQFLLQEKYEHVLVCGTDQLTAFVLKGFQSFQAVATQPCRPFDKSRTGINLGEAAAAIILNRAPQCNSDIIIASAVTTNDANHISGPSRSGEELALAIAKAMNLAQVAANDIDMISAHGTATPYNDEMESKAIALNHLENIPVHSFKSFIGHTLGAAGIIETIMIFEAMKHEILIPSLQYEEHGVSAAINICTQPTPKKILTALKTASGFGGINAAMIVQKAS